MNVGIRDRRDMMLSYVILAIVAIGVALWRMVIAPVSDDIVYAHAALPTCDEDFWDLRGQFISSWREVYESCVNHWLIVNGRLSNILTFVLLRLPPWLSATFNGLVAAATLWLVAICAANRRMLRSTWVISALALIFWKWLPWSDNMVSTCYYINYGWSGAIALAYSYLFLSHRCVRGLWIVATLLLCIVAGWMHEAFGIALCAASVVVVLSDSTCRRKRLLMLLFLYVGTAVAAFAPSTIGRADRLSDTLGVAGYVLTLVRVFGRFYPLYIYAVVLGLIWLLRGRAEVVRQVCGGLFWIVLAVMAVAIGITAQVAGRALWLPGLALLILTLRALADNFTMFRCPLPGLAIALTLVFVAFISSLIYWQHRVSEGQWNVISQVSATGRPYAFADVMNREDIPWWTLGIPQPYDPIGARYVAYSFTTPGEYDGFSTLILPPGYRGVPFDRWPAVGGDNTLRGVWPMMCSRDTVPVGTRLTLTTGAETPSMSPPAALLHRLMSRGNRAEATVSRVLPCLTEQSDTVWLYDLDVGRLGANLEIVGIDIDGR
ncbi:MAG: DUF6056 family protein [Pseudoflavonifractor sp.]|nr:DUF6056 family protein [Pseudoflavonifractor sp.]